MLLRLADPEQRDGEHAASAAGIEALSGLRAVVLLAGSVRANPLRKAANRCVLEMPIGRHRTVLDSWREHVVDMAERCRIAGLPVRIVVDRTANLGEQAWDEGGCELRVEQDPSDYRGTGGLLADIAREYGDGESLLVLHASQLLFEPLSDIAAGLAETKSDVAISCASDGTPSGLMLIRCGCLRSLNPVGFVDLNEQALPAIAARHDVRVVRYDRPIGMSMRTLEGYLDTLREYHRHASGRLERRDHFAEQWQPTFGLIEDGAWVHETSVVHDSVVLSGGRVEAGAVVVRSVVCPAGVVGRDRSVVDQIVAPGGAANRRRASR